MGGMGSGRHGGRPTVEDALALDLGKLLRDKLIRPGYSITSSLHWRNTRSGAEIASIGYRADMTADAGTFVADYAVTRRGERVPVSLSIGLVSTLQPFGGRRWWWVCPVTGDRATKLYLPGGATKFASRRAHGLAYRSQRETPFDRACSRAWGLRDRLGITAPIGDWCLRPRGMHEARWAREQARIEAADAVVDAQSRFGRRSEAAGEFGVGQPLSTIRHSWVFARSFADGVRSPYHTVACSG